MESGARLTAKLDLPEGVEEGSGVQRPQWLVCMVTHALIAEELNEPQRTRARVAAKIVVIRRSGTLSSRLKRI